MLNTYLEWNLPYYLLALRRTLFKPSLRILLAFGSLSFAVSILTAQSSSIHGVVKDARNGERLPNATLIIKGTHVGTQSNVEGFFLLSNVPDSVFVLQARYVGYGIEEVVVDSMKRTETIVVRMKPQDILMKGVTVSAQEATMLKTEREPSLTTVSPRQLITLPNIGQADIFRSMQLLPGISATNERSSGLYVRGGTPDQNLVLFDGMTVYHVDHFFGFFSAFNPDAIKDVQFYKGGFPSMYGGRLSSVMEISGKTGDPSNYHVSAGLNLLSGNALVEVPLFDKGSFLIAGRRSYSDIITTGAFTSLQDFLTGSSSSSRGPQGFGGGGPGGGRFGGVSTQETPVATFGDLNSKVTFNVSPQDVFSASFYNSSDRLDKSQSANSQTIPGIGSQFETPATTDVTQQGNLGASARWFHQWTKGLYSNAFLATAKYTSAYHYQVDRTNPNNSTQSRQSTDENNSINDISFRLDNRWMIDGNHEASFGTQISRTNVAYSLSATTIFNPSQTPFLDVSNQATQASFYAQDKWSHVADLPLDLTVGLRANTYSLTNEFFLEPRFAWRYLLSEHFSLKGAYGQYHQFTNRIINEDLSQGSRDFWVLADDQLRPGKADHYILGGTFENDEYIFDIESYYKSLDNLVEFSQRFRGSADDLYSFYGGSGTARGIEFLFQKKHGALNGWISYTLGRTESVFPDLNNGNPFPAESDQTHELKLVGNLGLWESWTLSSTFIFGSGQPYTAPISQYSITLLDSSSYQYTHISDKNAYRLPSYQRLDVSISKRWGKENSSHWIAGLSVFNLLNHTNVAYYQYDLNSNPIHVTTVTGLGLTPTLFVQVDF